MLTLHSSVWERRDSSKKLDFGSVRMIWRWSIIWWWAQPHSRVISSFWRWRRLKCWNANYAFLRTCGNMLWSTWDEDSDIQLNWIKMSKFLEGTWCSWNWNWCSNNFTKAIITRFIYFIISSCEIENYVITSLSVLDSIVLEFWGLRIWSIE